MADPDIKYKTESGRRDAVRAFNDTYGMCEVEEVGPDDIPDDLERL